MATKKKSTNTGKKAAKKTPTKKPAQQAKTPAKKKAVAAKKEKVKKPGKKAATPKKAVSVKKPAAGKKTAGASAPSPKSTPKKAIVKKSTTAEKKSTVATKAKPSAKKAPSTKIKAEPKPVKAPKKAAPAPSKPVKAKKQPAEVNGSAATKTGKPKFVYKPEPSILDAPNDQPRKRYSDGELQEFKVLIQGKLEAARKELAYLQGLITRKDEAGTDDTENKYMGVEDGSGTMEREQLSQLASRQIQFIDKLEKALQRIENKTYGICRETGKLIDKARLRAVPHATLSIEAKLAKKR